METVYIETTVVSYLVSRPSQDVAVAAHQQLTQEWWRRRRRSFACFISDVSPWMRSGDGRRGAGGFAHESAGKHSEARGDSRRRASGRGVSRRRVLPAKAAGDAVHLAIATVGKVKYLLTWNCNHLANAQLLDRLEPIAASSRDSNSRGFARQRS